MNNGDSIDGGAGNDTLTATLTGGLNGATIENVENLNFRDTAASTVVFSTTSENYITGVEDVKYTQSNGDITLTRLTEIPSITLDNVVDDVTVTFADSVLAGDDDTLELNVNGFVLAGGNGGENIDVGTVSDTDGDIENLTVNATGVGSDFNDLDSAFVDVADVTVTGDANVDFGATAAFAALETFDSTDSTGNVTLLLGADGVTGSDNTKTLTFGAGDDSLDLGALAPGEVGAVTIDAGAGDDTIDLDDFADTDMVVKGGAGDDRLVTSATITAANAANIGGFEIFELAAASQSMFDIGAGNNFETLAAAAGTTSFTNVGSDVSTLELVGGVADTTTTVSRFVDAEDNGLTIKATTADVDLDTGADFDDEESLTFDSSDFNILIDGADITSTDLTSLTLVGDNSIKLGTTTHEFTSTKLETIDASGVTGTEAVDVFAVNSTVDMTVTGPASTGTFTLATGSGDDTITAGAGVLDVDAGAGDDTIIGGEGADVIDGGAGRDVIDLTETTAAADKVTLSSGATTVDKIIGFDAGGANTDDDLIALTTTHSWNSTGGDTVLTLDTGSDLKSAVDSTNDDTTAVTISTNATAGTFEKFLEGTITEAAMESAVISALGLTGSLDDEAILLVLVDDGEDTGVFKFTGGDAATDDAVDASEIEIMGVLEGISDATSVVAGDIAFS